MSEQDNSITMKQILDMFCELKEKIENLENTVLKKYKCLEEKLQYIEQKQIMSGSNTQKTVIDIQPNHTPSLTFQQWLEQISVMMEDLTNIFDIGILDGFYSCLGRNMPILESPFWISPTKTKQIYLFDLSNMAWRIMSENDIVIIIEEIWRKMIEFYFIKCEEEYMELSEQDQTQRDIKKKGLIDMKKKMIQKHTMDIAKCIVKNCEQKK